MYSIGQAKTRVVSVPKSPDTEMFPDPNRFELMAGPIQGGMGAVFKARDKSQNRIVAIKRMLPQYAADPELTERFRREAEAMQRCNHPGLIQIYERSEDANGLYIVMEWIDGIDLEKHLKIVKKMPGRKAAEVIIRVARALQAAHDQGLIHRDIKPANILIDGSGNPHLTDFGIVRISAESAAADQFTVAGQILGTVDYMSPEQVNDPASVSIRSDVFSLAATLYRMVTGMSLRTRDERAEEIPEWLRDVVFKSLRSLPSERHATAAEFARDLQSAIDKLPSDQIEEFILSERGGNCDGITRRITMGASSDRHGLDVVRSGHAHKSFSRRNWISGVIMTGFGYVAWKSMSEPEQSMSRSELESETPPDAASASVSNSTVRSVEDFSVARVFPESASEVQREWENRLSFSHPLRNSAGMLFRLVPPGISRIGSPSSEEGHTNGESTRDITVREPILFGVYPVTQQQWSVVMKHNPSLHRRGELGDPAGDLANHPAENITWNRAMEFIDTLNRIHPMTGWRYRLPMESEWEYACRAGTLTPFHFGDLLNGTSANCDGSFPYGTSEPGPALLFPSVVGLYASNAWGLYDMHGNVWEWCDEVGSAGGPSTARAVSGCVLRGGAWNCFPVACRSAVRHPKPPDFSDATTGLRVVCEKQV